MASCPPPLPKTGGGWGGSEQKAVPLLSCWGPIPLLLLYPPGAEIGPGGCRRGCSTLMAAGSSSVRPRHKAELQLMAHGSVCCIPSWTLGTAALGWGITSSPGPAPPWKPLWPGATRG